MVILKTKIKWHSDYKYAKAEKNCTLTYLQNIYHKYIFRIYEK